MQLIKVADEYYIPPGNLDLYIDGHMNYVKVIQNTYDGKELLIEFYDKPKVSARNKHLFNLKMYHNDTKMRERLVSEYKFYGKILSIVKDISNKDFYNYRMVVKLICKIWRMV